MSIHQSYQSGSRSAPYLHSQPFVVSCRRSRNPDGGAGSESFSRPQGDEGVKNVVWLCAAQPVAQETVNVKACPTEQLCPLRQPGAVALPHLHRGAASKLKEAELRVDLDDPVLNRRTQANVHFGDLGDNSPSLLGEADSVLGTVALCGVRFIVGRRPQNRPDRGRKDR